MSKLQLGWYKSKEAGELVRLLYVAEDVINRSAIYQRNNFVFCVVLNFFESRYEFVSVEKPVTWVPADPKKITLDMLPMRARFCDREGERWVEGKLIGYSKKKYGKNKFLELDETFADEGDSFETWDFCEIAE